MKYLGSSIFFLCFLVSCQQDKVRVFYIPDKYEGWVNIIYDQEGVSVVKRKQDTVFYYLKGDLTRCGVAEDFRSGWSQEQYYYCSQKDTIRINKAPRRHYIHNHFTTKVVLNKKEHDVEAFFVLPSTTYALEDSVVWRNPLLDPLD
jgi:hypothetical protein